MLARLRHTTGRATALVSVRREGKRWLQLPAVAWQRGGYSHRMSPRVTWVWRRSRRRRPRGRTTLLRGPRTSQPPSPFCRNYLPSLRSLPGSLARNLAEQRSAPNSTTPRYGSPAPSTCLAREALLLRQLRYSTGQRAPACFYTPYRAYLAAAGTRTYAPPPRSPGEHHQQQHHRGTPVRSDSTTSHFSSHRSHPGKE